MVDTALALVGIKEDPAEIHLFQTSNTVATVGGEMKFACVDGPDFDGYEVDFDEAMSRGRMYADFERHAYEDSCNLFKKEVE